MDRDVEIGARFSQAARIVATQTDCTTSEAVILMGERAQIEHVSLWALARAVIEGTIRFR